MKLTKDYTIETVMGKTLLMPAGQKVIDGGMVYQLNESAAQILSLLKEDISREDLESRCREIFEIRTPEEEAEFHADTDPFIAELIRKGIIAE